MHTPTHFLMTTALGQWLKGFSPSRSAMAIGSVTPDLSLYLLTAGAVMYFTRIETWPTEQAFEHIFHTLYFEHPVWITLHNVFHSPVSIALMFALVWMLRRFRVGWTHWLTWFLIACSLHSMVDILTHHNDGPLLLWPFHWDLRFQSPVSYWDTDHFAAYVIPIEILLNLVLLGYLIYTNTFKWFRRRRDEISGSR